MVSPRLFLVVGTLFVVSGILCLLRSQHFSTQGENTRANVLEQNQENQRLIQNFLRGEEFRASANTLLATMTAVRGLREQSPNPKYDDEEFSTLRRETERAMRSAIHTMSVASGSKIPAKKDRESLGFYGLMDDLTSKFVKHLNDRVAKKNEMEKREGEHRSKARCWSYLAHSLNILGILLIMGKDLVPAGTRG